MDLTEESEMISIGVMSVVNKAESLKKRRRIRDWRQDRIPDGLPHSGPRPFGREEDRKTLRPDEAMFPARSIDERIKGEAMLLANLAEEKPTAAAGRQVGLAGRAVEHGQDQ
ncbi:hypothetical protein ACIA98_14835 [Streptomyces sp. NPDC051366]|uniref:hypothetical protein n=1 Tax=Streptomyces sp. NPDC051366 TaxID=3365652 RepID=UPI0037A588B8